MKSIGDSAETTARPPLLPLPDVTSYVYTYSDSEWGDLLTSYRGTAITYDEVGNPLSYYNGSSYTFGWQGRRLVSAVKGTDTMSFAYNDAGLRISKTVNGVTTHYVYDGDILLAEYTDNETIVYIYDANDSPIGFKYRASSYEADVWDVYWYGKNLQGDVLYVYNASGTKLISYTYNAWGKTTVSHSNGGASTTAVKNNLAYRGYYYDSDLGMYYLQSRYYDSNICRFINADSALYHSMLGYNMFAYCENNPVNYYDPTGENAEAIKWGVSAWWLTLLDGPLPIGDILYYGALAAILIVSLKTADNLKPKADADSSNSITEPGSNSNEDKDDGNDSESAKNSDVPKDYVGADSNKKANKWAKKAGYQSAESLKKDFVGNDGRKFNMFKNRPTGEIILIGIKSGIEIFTDLFIK